jgi:hypothetical protein
MQQRSRIPHLLRRTVLGEEAVYRVIEVSGDLVVVEVVSAPGLPTGTVLRVTQASVAAMSVVEEPLWRRLRRKPVRRRDQEAAENTTPRAASR